MNLRAMSASEKSWASSIHQSVGSRACCVLHSQMGLSATAAGGTVPPVNAAGIVIADAGTSVVGAAVDA